MTGQKVGMSEWRRRTRDASRSSPQLHLEQLPRRQWVARLGDEQGVDDRRLVDADGEELADPRGGERGVEAQRDVRREGEARTRVLETARLQPLVQHAQRAVRVERQHDDLGLHEAHRRQEVQLDRRGLGGDRLDGRAQRRGRRARRDGPRARRADDREMRPAHRRELGVVALVDGRNALGRRASQLGDDEDAGEGRHSGSALRVSHRESRRGGAVPPSRPLPRDSPSSHAERIPSSSQAHSPGSTSRLSSPPRMDPASSHRSTRLSGWLWWYFTTLRPAKVPKAAPMMTSLAQCLLLYMRETPTSAAPPYIAVPTYHFECGHQSADSSVTAAAAAKAIVLWPEGKERYSSCRQPRLSPKFRGFSGSRYGRARPAVPLISVVATPAMAIASVPCSPRSAIRSLPPIRPTP